MSCSKHIQRKRKECPDCFPPDAEIESPADVVNDVDCVSIPQIHTVGNHVWNTDGPIIDKPPEEVPVHHRFDEKEYIKDLIDRTVKEVASKIRAELSDLRSISWEHLDIPIGLFSISLMYALGNEGWVYKDAYRGEIAKVSGLREEAIIMTRVKSPKWPAIPDFSKRNTLKRYLEKE